MQYLHIHTHTHARTNTSCSRAPDKYRDSKGFDRRFTHSAHRPLTHSCQLQPRLSSIYGRRSLPDTAQFRPSLVCVFVRAPQSFNHIGFPAIYLTACIHEPVNSLRRHIHTCVSGVYGGKCSLLFNTSALCWVRTLGQLVEVPPYFTAASMSG